LELSPNKSIEAFAVIVDINAFTTMVSRSNSNTIAQFTRDILVGAVHNIELCGGDVVGFMGDAILGLLETAQATYGACAGIARDVNRQCEYISVNQRESAENWAFCPGGPSLKLGIEYGYIDCSTISSNRLGEQLLFIGDAINYAARITKPRIGNRCHVGPNAASRGLDSYPMKGPYKTEGKPGEGFYEYFHLDLSDIWLEGKRRPGRRTYINY
jgi:hypothetical protein